jgi:alpha-galactosidase
MLEVSLRTWQRYSLSVVAVAALVAGSLPILLGGSAQPASAQDKGLAGLAPTPPMGFNNWNSTHCRGDFNEAMIKGIADIFVSKGLKAAGYEYVNLDDCWAQPKRNAEGNLVPNPTRFPNGIKAVADYVHSKGLKFGIYTSAGTATCDVLGFPGGLDHEDQDAKLFASWGVDYLKYDNCHNQGRDSVERYTKMRDAIAKTGRPMVFSICEWGESQPWRWAHDVGQLWRTTGDIEDKWSSMLSILHRTQSLAPYARPGAWNDPDMLEVGNGGMTDTEYRSHFSLWAMLSAPLLIGTDLRKASAATLNILTNKDVIAVDQDRLGKQAYVVKSSGGLTVYSKLLANGDRAVALFNETGSTKTISTSARELGLGAAASYRLRDLWSKATTTTTGSITASVPSHGTVIYRVSGGGAPSFFALEGDWSGRCLDVYDNQVHNGAGMEIWDCNGGANQRWNLTAAGELRAYDGTRCLDVRNGGTSPGTSIGMWDCHGGSNQRFRLNDNGTITALASNMCLDIRNNGTDNGTGVVIWTCHGGANQLWKRR